MPDIASIATLLSSVQSAAEIAKLIRGADVSLEKAELNLRLADIINALADARVQVADVRELMLEKESQISELKKLIDIKGRMNYEAPYYWLEDEGKKDGPFCQNCYDSNFKLIRLQPCVTVKGIWDCKSCNNDFKDSSYARAGAQVPQRGNW